MRAAAVFLLVAVWDALWAAYIVKTTERKASAAANYSAALYLLSAFNVLAISRDPWLAIPGVLGAWVGTWFAVRRS